MVWLSCSTLPLSILYLLFSPPLVLFNLPPVGLGGRINGLTGSIDGACVPIATCESRAQVTSEGCFWPLVGAEGTVRTHPLAWRSDQTAVNVQTICSYGNDLATGSRHNLLNRQEVGQSRRGADQTNQDEQLHVGVSRWVLQVRRWWRSVGYWCLPEGPHLYKGSVGQPVLSFVVVGWIGGGRGVLRYPPQISLDLFTRVPHVCTSSSDYNLKYKPESTVLLL